MSEAETQPGRERGRRPQGEPGPGGSDRGGSREGAEPLLAAHGPAVHAYCTAILEPQAAADVLAEVFEYVEEHGAELAALDEPSIRLTLYAIAQNRGRERGRSGGRAPSAEGLGPEALRIAEAFAALRPVGRAALVLRAVLGLRWSELERVCGVPRRRAVMQVCRAWRRMAAAAGPRPQEPPPSAALDTPEGWSVIRADARRFAALREGLRRAHARRSRPDDWRDEIWRRLDQRRAEAALEEARHEQRKRARAAAARPDPPEPSPAGDGPSASSADAALEAVAPEPPAASNHAAASEPLAASNHARRWGVLGVGLIVAGLIAYAWSSAW